MAHTGSVSAHFADELVAAVEHNQVGRITEILNSNPDLVNVCGHQSRETALIKAVKLNSIERVEMLLGYFSGIDVNIREAGEPYLTCNQTPLMIAAEHGYVNIARLLINHSSFANINAKNSSNMCECCSKTALKYAVEGDHAEFVRLLLNQPDINIRLTDPFRAAASLRSPEVLMALLTHPDINVNRLMKNIRDMSDIHSIFPPETALHIAVENRSIRSLYALLAHPNIDVNVSSQGVTPLTLAAARGHIDIVRILLAVPEINVNCEALHQTASRGHVEIARLLLERPEIQVNNLETNNRATALMIAAYWGNMEMMRLLVSVPDVDINAACEHKRLTALMLAAKMGHTHAVNLLLGHGADINATDRSGKTQLICLQLVEYRLYHVSIDFYGKWITDVLV
eukprot:1000232_1